MRPAVHVLKNATNGTRFGFRLMSVEEGLGHDWSRFTFVLDGSYIKSGDLSCGDVCVQSCLSVTLVFLVLRLLCP